MTCDLCAAHAASDASGIHCLGPWAHAQAAAAAGSRSPCAASRSSQVVQDSATGDCGSNI
jgi:hypothetical protein